MQILYSELEAKVLKTLKKLGLDEEQTKRTAEPLLWAEKSGIKAMGIAKLTGTEPLQDIRIKSPVNVEFESDISARIDGGGGPATLVSQIATDLVIKKAQRSGIAIVGARNMFSSNLTQAYYVERIAKEGLVGIAMSRAAASTAIFGGTKPLVGTNPIGFGFPTKSDPLLFDTTTSAMTWYGLVLAKLKGKKIPNDVAIDSEGAATNDPAVAMKGALLSFDRSYKGDGLALAIELLAGPLIGAGYASYESDSEWGYLFIAIDPAVLTDPDEFTRRSTDLLDKVRGSSKRPGVADIRLPGERALAARNQVDQTGQIEVDEDVMKVLGYI